MHLLSSLAASLDLPLVSTTDPFLSFTTMFSVHHHCTGCDALGFRPQLVLYAMGTPTLLGGKLRRTELSCLLLVMGRDGPEAVVLFLMTDAFLPGGFGALGLVGGGPLVVVGHYRHCSPPAGSADPVSASSVCPPRTWQCTLHTGNATIQGQCCQVPLSTAAVGRAT